MMTSTLRSAVLLALSVAPAFAQNPRWVDMHYADPGGFGGVYDPRRDRVVRFFGGPNVFERDPRGWNRVLVTGGITDVPVFRTAFAAAYDGGRKAIVIFGGATVNALGDTWEWDGVRWSRINSVISPPRRFRATMAWDAVRDEMVLCGGADAGPLSDTWMLRDGEWRRAPNSVAYGPNPVMTFDAARGEIVLVGRGAFHFDGVNWRVGDASIAASTGSAIAFDRARGVVALFSLSGGVQEYDGFQWRNSVQLPTAGELAAHFDERTGLIELAQQAGSSAWTWDGARFGSVESQVPVVRSGTAAFTDSNASRVVAFGVDRSGGAATWVREGRTWSLLPTATSPPTRCTCGAAFDPLRGVGLTMSDRGDLWAFDGTDWSQVASGPPARQYGHVAFDSVRDRLLVTGGYSGGALVSDVWEWDGASWTQVPVSGLHVGYLGAVTFDPVRGRIVAVTQGVMHEWDGVQWLAIGSAPFGAARPMLAFDPARGRLMLSSGPSMFELVGTTWQPAGTSSTTVTDLEAMVISPDTGWPLMLGRDHIYEWRTPRRTSDSEVLGPACGSPRATIQPNGRARIGTSDFAIEVAFEPARATWFALSHTLRPSPLEIGNGCQMLLEGPLSVSMQFADSLGLATLEMPINLSGQLVGVQIFAQAAIATPSATPGFVMTQGLRVQIGQ